MSKQFAKLKVYELGGGVAFQTETGAVPFLVIPKGQATMKPWGTSGFVFENIVTGDVIAYVDTFDDLLDSAGVAWGISQAAVFTAVGAFFFRLSGGGDAIDVTYNKSNYQSFALTPNAFINSNFAIGTNVHLCFPILIQEDVTIERLRIVITTGSVGNTVYGLYSALNGLPDSLIFQTTAFNNNITAIQEYILPSPLTVNKGLYFVSYNTSSTYTIRSMYAYCYPNIFGDDNLYSGPRILASNALVYSGVLPATFGALTTIYEYNVAPYIPYVQFKIS